MCDRESFDKQIIYKTLIDMQNFDELIVGFKEESLATLQCLHKS